MSAGAYEYEKGMRNYWIPGRRIRKASSPVPVDGSQTVRTEFRDSLMWLNALGCELHRVYFGTQRGTLKYIDEVRGDDNIIHLSHRLTRGQNYRWRVDAICNGKTVEGDIWTFKTI